MDYPFTGVFRACDQEKKKIKAATIDSFCKVPESEEMLKIAVKNQPVTATLCVDDRFEDYTGGIYRFQAPCEDIDSINHTITIVGYGREDDVDYWIIKNSWGTNWEEQGFMRLERNVNSYGGNCGITLEAYCPIKKGLHVPKFAIWSIKTGAY